MDKRMNLNLNRPLYIFDLDGTLALIEHRLHLIQPPHKDWRAFFAACTKDQPNELVLQTLKLLRKGGAEIWVWSGRSDEVRSETEDWLHQHDIVQRPFRIPKLRMRKYRDHRLDEIVKREWLDELGLHDRSRLVAIFDDRTRMVNMWRNANEICFQVAPGNF